jgi:hypothetical protein
MGHFPYNITRNIYSEILSLSFFPMSFLSNLEWRYATKKFDPTKKVSSENLSKILEAIRMTPTSVSYTHLTLPTSP